MRLQVADLDRSVGSCALAAVGLADIMTVPPNVAYAEIYLDATRAARDAGLELDQATAPARAPEN